MINMDSSVLDVNYFNPDAFQTIDKYVDSFQYIKEVKTDLLYGRPAQTNVFLSVVIPTYNRNEIFKSSLLSVLKQKLSDIEWEVLVIDNTPLDNGCTPALEIVREINDDRVLYYHNEKNIGSGYSWNRAVELARGKWITFLHDDDLLYSNALCNIVEQIQSESDQLGFIYGTRTFFSNENDVNLDYEKRCIPIQLTRKAAIIRYFTDTGAPSCGTTISKEAYCYAGGINKDFGPVADAVLSYQIMKRYRVVTSAYILGAYRWGVNETLNVQTVVNLIKTDLLFADYRFRTDNGKIWKMLFRKSQITCDVIEKAKVCRCSIKQICKDAGIDSVNRFSIFRFIYLMLRKSYSLMRICKGWVKTKWN